MTNIDLSRVDWKELRKQKETLIRKITASNNDDLEGILNFLDHIQDEAAKELGEETVFPGIEMVQYIVDIQSTRIDVPKDIARGSQLDREIYIQKQLEQEKPSLEDYEETE